MNTVTFSSADGLEITADEYFVSDTLPYILLFHEQESSRGEFQTIAQRLTKMNYNCLAVDLRNGGNNNTVSNETAKNCRENRCRTGVEDIEQDMVAAIEYIALKSDAPVILFGCGANGALSLKLAEETSQVKAVLALSPGEYFLPGVNIQESISDLDKPVFITSGKSEFPFVKELSSGIPGDYLTLFEPQLSEEGRGTTVLSADNPNNSEYWLALILFFKDLI